MSRHLHRQQIARFHIHVVMHGPAVTRVLQLKRSHMQLHLKDEPLHVRIAPSAEGYKLHKVGSGVILDARETHFDFKSEVPVASKQLLSSNTGIESVSYAHYLHDLRGVLCARARALRTTAPLAGVFATAQCAVLQQLQEELNVGELLEHNLGPHKVCQAPEVAAVAPSGL